MSVLAAAAITLALVLVGCGSTAGEGEGGASGSPAAPADAAVIAPDVFATPAGSDISNETILLTGPFEPKDGVEALEAAGNRFMRVDETGVEHLTDDGAAAALMRGLYTPNYVSEPLRTALGLELYVDCKGWISEPMRLTFRRILAEELQAAGLSAVAVVAARP